ncbi:hypothetical protein C8J57DRAFT_1214999 [Mycena rebaudengoi]|nr:hypothetical protein C8J57DRAFT_1214999 [Mycena rebaudengoi]
MGGSSRQKTGKKLVQAKEKKKTNTVLPKPTLKLRLIGPKTPQRESAGPDAAAAPSSPDLAITPPPELTKKELRAAVAKYMKERCVALSSEDEENSETEDLLIGKTARPQDGVFSDGVEVNEPEGGRLEGHNGDQDQLFEDEDQHSSENDSEKQDESDGMSGIAARTSIDALRRLK